MKFDIEDINRSSRKDYEKAWIDSKKLLEMRGQYFKLQNLGKSHPINDFIQEAREFMIELGFQELILPMFVDESDVYDEYESLNSEYLG